VELFMDEQVVQCAFPAARFRVLASGSSGNCSMLMPSTGSRRRVCLIDAGLSQRRTMELLSKSGVDPDEVACVILTHLDHDHWNSGWTSRWPRGWHLWLSREHAAFARRRRLVPMDAVRMFDNAAFEPVPGVAVTPVEASHDELGVSSFRFDIGRQGASLGFATDLGRVPETLIECIRGVNVLAIESNYCPHMQMASNRPWFLKQRIMGGQGHLSNEQSLHAVGAIEPKEHVVLLHLSRECNDPSLVASMHAGSDYAVTIADQETPSRWVDIGEGSPRAPQPPRVGAQLDMFPAGA
jgi:phosphoribosyl 1,2-cyclic phosphodiesterase